MLFRRRYPHSLGLLYSAFTRRCGLRPNEDEYTTMGMAAFGEPRYTDHLRAEWIAIDEPGFRLRANVHRGIGDWMPEALPEDLAAGVQAVTEEVLPGAARWARRETGSRNLVLMGGVALNCVANSRICATGDFDHVWIFPNPGDAGSSLGAVAATTREPVTWSGPSLGTEIRRALDPHEVVDGLKADGVLAVANGRAEFGPRAGQPVDPGGPADQADEGPRQRGEGAGEVPPVRAGDPGGTHGGVLRDAGPGDAVHVVHRAVQGTRGGSRPSCTPTAPTGCRR
nr:carbamoyltransferase N-terminal domain-containing protein [Saccharothrix luteola]